jgi:hypothetical protein
MLNNHFISMADLTKTDNIIDIQPFIEKSMQYLKIVIQTVSQLYTGSMLMPGR